MQHETELVIALSRTPLSAGARSRIEQMLSSAVDWDVVRDLVVRWQIQPTVFGNLRTDFATTIPPAVLADFTTREREARAYAVTRTLVLVDLVRRLGEAGISALVLKGPAVSIAAYGDYSRRTFGDVDLLLHRSDLPAARDFLLARGLVRDFPEMMEDALVADQHALEFSDAHTKVELHWSLLSRHLHFDIDLGEIWARAENVQCMGSELRVLAIEHLFLYLCAHGAKHEWMLFRWILDIAQLENRLDPKQAEGVMSLARQTNAERILALGLRIARDTFGEGSSPFSPRALLAERDTRSLAELVRKRLDPARIGGASLLPQRITRIHPYLEPLAFWIMSRERRRDQMACAATFLFLPAASDTTGGEVHGLLRPVRLVARAIRRMVGPDRQN